MANVLKALFGGSNEAEIKRLEKIARKIDSFEEAHRRLSEQELRGMTDVFRRRLKDGETLDDLLPEAFSVVREAMDRVLGKRHFHVQMLGGIVLHQGRIAEMKTGEGKTLVATLPTYLNALTGNGVHVVTVNDYLARFQGEWMGKVYRYLGMRVGVIVHDMDNNARRAAYAADITYGTNNEFGFDYLRDNMVIYKKDMVQRGHAFAIVDEADSILIDEARTPLIISGQGDKSTDMYQRADRFVSRLREETDYTKDEKDKAVSLTEEGIRKAEEFFGLENLADIENNDINHHINAALRANVLMHRDDDYVVQNGQVIIVDEFTGRLMVGRRYSDGLHQAIEAKEHVNVERESKTLATITFQNYFRMYKKLSGMTGTAKTEEEEFKGIYRLDVVQIPTNRPMIRKDLNDVVYRTARGKFRAVVEEIVRRHETGQPVLVGTVSVEKSELLSRMLEMRGVPHEVLNAKHHEKEAEIVAQAGHFGAVTIATNMAGRGTDILLGGNPEFLARRALRQQGVEETVIEAAMGHDEQVGEDVLAVRAELERLEKQFSVQTDAEHDRVVAVGGLHIIGTERHESRRIDNQLRGRAGRQGDPGSSQFFIALEDDLMRLFGSERFSGMIERLGLDEDTPIEARMLTRQIENAQKRIEGRNYDIRRHVLQYDDVMNQQRDVIYGQRRQVLEGENMRGQILGMAGNLIEAAVQLHTGRGDNPSEWDIPGLAAYLERYCVPQGWLAQHAGEYRTRQALQDALNEAAEAAYAQREQALAEAGIDMREFERVVLLSSVDRRWMDHIDAMDRLRDGIGLRAYGHRDPVVEYKFEGFEMFDEMVRLIREDTLLKLYHAQVRVNLERRQVAQPTQERLSGAGAGGPKQPRQAVPKVGRNEPCPCGSGKKYKHCCGRNA
ncbi:MAG TPA: preprotein translocase subunit SecA [Candidatus Avichristensenella intestinipullorum]|uniref:Protein translocase subunit SecA n=1 Tax=Candidatus Avichristensenella intestinipullorum TaxID=2840693 RepID=A0A9D1CI16_9FIRM|nr:preprotein translocase subunit SecA [Candidatus Avichristensenella intestinipullorum]